MSYDLTRSECEDMGAPRRTVHGGRVYWDGVLEGYTECPDCAGDGETEDGDTCPRCDGEGYVEE